MGNNKIDNINNEDGGIININNPKNSNLKYYIVGVSIVLILVIFFKNANSTEIINTTNSPNVSTLSGDVLLDYSTKVYINENNEHTSLKILKQGISYSEARKILLNDRWQATYSRWQDIPSFEEDRVHQFYYDKGWQEIENCSGTGMGYCLFNFHDENGNRLTVVTAGESDNPIVYNWNIDIDKK